MHPSSPARRAPRSARWKKPSWMACLSLRGGTMRWHARTGSPSTTRVLTGVRNASAKQRACSPGRSNMRSMISMASCSPSTSVISQTSHSMGKRWQNRPALARRRSAARLAECSTGCAPVLPNRLYRTIPNMIEETNRNPGGFLRRRTNVADTYAPKRLSCEPRSAQHFQKTTTISQQPRLRSHETASLLECSGAAWRRSCARSAA
jgi:hypothetical protein